MSEKPVLYLHSSAGLYGADLLLAEMVRGSPRPAVCVLPEPGPLAGRLAEAGAEIVIHPLAVLRRALANPFGAAHLAGGVWGDARALKELAQGSALVHANTSVVMSAQRIARSARVPCVVHVREIYAEAGGRAAEAMWPRLRRRLQKADALACISDAVAAQFDADNVSVIRDGLVRTIAPSLKGPARERLGIPPDAFCVALVGRVSDWKGQDVLARALAEPQLAEWSAVGLIVGDAVAGAEESVHRLDALATELRIDDRLRRIGFREDLSDVLGAADALVVPSTRPEPLGQVALEGASAGLPVVASRAGGLPEVVSDGETGLLVEPGDPASLAAALLTLAADPRHAQRLGAAGRYRVRQLFGADRMNAEIAALHDSLL